VDRELTLVTTLGPLRHASDRGLVLPHEHVFCDLRTYESPDYAQADEAEVSAAMTPLLRQAREQGVTAMVEPSTVGVGRRVDLLLTLSQTSGLPLVVPTGVYREPWTPPWVHSAEEAELRDWMLAELTDGIENTGVRAGWIKLSAGDEGLTPTESKVLRAAAGAAQQAGAAIGSHTISGRVVLEQIAVLDAAGFAVDRFVWIHAQREVEAALHLEVARRGAAIEYDGIGRRWRPQGSNDRFVQLVLDALKAGLTDRLLLSQDLIGYDPALPGGGDPQPYTYLTEVFLPLLRAAGIDEETLRTITSDNPWRLFGRA
jgi:phosphotriesterase-related protein